MSYQKHTWVKNEVIRGKQLNHLEDGVYNEEQRAIEVENGLASDISDEITRASTEEDSLSNRITLNTQQLAKLDGSVTVEGSIKYQIQAAIEYMQEYVDERIPNS